MYYKITDTLYINTDPRTDWMMIAANEAAARENSINSANNAFAQIFSIV